MTVLRRDFGAISNYFHNLTNDIGHRGSSFTDLDACTHDLTSGRFLFQEFKQATEAMSKGQWRTLRALARLERVTVWCVRRRDDGLLDWCDVALRIRETITEAEYQARFERWWRDAIILVGPEPIAELTASDIPW